ncbi:hypothetical protein DVH24_041890 [Malus domestica]|uniref:Uncharacterized protein n=1 Tax=Malus domestica TaxID=3750 RepID=A0A498IT77_MALDO|nr:hypothetical protein DVH24_041890 [Malus domestica]
MKKKERGKVGAVMNSWGKYGIIRETDMWNKRPEFTAWLLEVKLVNLEHLANWEEKQICCKTRPEKGMKASNSTCYCDTQRDNYGVHTDAACTTQSAINSGVILGLCQQRRVLFTAHHYSVQHSSVAVLDRISDICTSKAVGTTWHPCNNKQDVKSDKGKDKSGASDDNSHGRLLSALNSSGGLNVSYSCG